MEYKKYIELGFVRTDLDCQIEFNKTGYRGFSLEKQVNEKMTICALSGELEKPRLYIKKREQDRYHIISISAEAVIDLLYEPKNSKISAMFNAG